MPSNFFDSFAVFISRRPVSWRLVVSLPGTPGSSLTVFRGRKQDYNLCHARRKESTVPEFYVYLLEARGIPFYVGIGRDKRADDRIRYVRYLMKRAESGVIVRWCMSNHAVAHFLQRNEEVRVNYLRKRLTRERALILEVETILKLASSPRVLLANYQHNPNRPSSVDDVVRSVLRGQRRQ
jgi:hypothetical protein